MAKDIRVLLYYKYVPIENAEQFAADHLAFCKSIGLKGRILVADEGINGTVSGDYETTQKYMDYVHSLPGMEDLWFKIDEENEQAFKKMFVRMVISTPRASRRDFIRMSTTLGLAAGVAAALVVCGGNDGGSSFSSASQASSDASGRFTIK